MGGLSIPKASFKLSGIMTAITSEQIRAARALLRWEQKDLADASKVSLPSIKRLETTPGPLAAQQRTIDALRKAIEEAGVEFTNGGQNGVRLRKSEMISKRPITRDQLQRLLIEALAAHGFDQIESVGIYRGGEPDPHGWTIGTLKPTGPEVTMDMLKALHDIERDFQTKYDLAD